eukprot:5517454-Lingulodinium_polyedra.AAC.1
MDGDGDGDHHAARARASRTGQIQALRRSNQQTGNRSMQSILDKRAANRGDSVTGVTAWNTG